MKILYIITKSEIGGAQTYVASLSRYMKDQGHTVGVMASRGGWLEHESLECGVSFFHNKFFANTYNPFRVFRAIQQVRKTIQEFQPDIVHVNSGAASFFGRVAARGLGLKVIYTVHGWSFRKGVPIVQRAVSLLVEKVMRFFTDHVICVSEYDKHNGINQSIINNENSSVIYNGTTVPLAQSTSQSNEKRRVVFAGRYAPPKRQEVAIQALALLGNLNVELVCAGQGVRERFFKKIAERLGVQDKVTFQSYTPSGMSQLYRTADMLVLISDYEAFPMVIIEAMAHGVPVIASNVGGISEAVDSQTGVLLDSPDKNSVANAIRSLIENEHRIEKMGSLARERVIDKFSVEEMCNKTKEIYERYIK